MIKEGERGKERDKGRTNKEGERRKRRRKDDQGRRKREGKT